MRKKGQAIAAAVGSGVRLNGDEGVWGAITTILTTKVNVKT